MSRTRVKQNCGLSRLSSPNVTLTIQGWTDFESFRWQSNAERRGARNMIDRGNPCGHIRRAPVKRKISRNILLDASVPQPIPPLQLPTTYDSSFSEVRSLLLCHISLTHFVPAYNRLTRFSSDHLHSPSSTQTVLLETRRVSYTPPLSSTLVLSNSWDNCTLL